MGSLHEKIVAEDCKSRRPMAEHVRRGTCLLNAAQYDEAIAELGMAVEVAPDADSLQTYLASYFQDQQEEASSGEGPIDALRDAIAEDSENAGLHFQLGVLLTECGRLEEAELRFTQVLSISRDHVEALVYLAICYQLRGELRQGISLLQRAQELRPDDAKITLLLAKAAKVAHDAGSTINLFAMVTSEETALSQSS